LLWGEREGERKKRRHGEVGHALTQTASRYRCTGCGGMDGMLLDISQDTATLGMAYSTSNPLDVTNASSTLVKHSSQGVC